MSKHRVLLILILIVHLPIHAKWIWTPQGWINTEYNNQDQAKKLVENGKKFLKKGDKAAAKESFETAWEYFPDSEEGQEALFLLAKLNEDSGNKYRAYQDLNQFLKSNPSSKKIQTIAEKQYEIGYSIIRGKTSTPPEKGVEILRGVINRIPHAEFADDAQMAIANFYYKNKRYQEAQVEYEELIKKHKQSEWLSRAKYLKITCLQKLYKGDEYDVTPLKNAKKEIDSYVDSYGDTNEFEAAEKAQNDITEGLARKEISIAEFYIRRDKLHSAKIYLQYVLRKYPRTRSAQKAKLLLKRIGKS
ncbi:outer membrane protein assembly factor BamD [Candidatus Uabimicrobium amorphum]|uniref:Outer membrane protein assembly factor BamD n=1 Tax=Uabimicrobium amorphum TaxID=2596890 RepID=A0A5S9F3B7_UABAM|nr:outer membrane protein assembly factor BamD [Candidatus Uabimicrobium amorphum]BBM84003.1 outer membrane protein assembly factor BamD [Candidatus Uabimicrobium amorphum]